MAWLFRVLKAVVRFFINYLPNIFRHLWNERNSTAEFLNSAFTLLAGLIVFLLALVTLGKASLASVFGEIHIARWGVDIVPQDINTAHLMILIVSAFALPFVAVRCIEAAAATSDFVKQRQPPKGGPPAPA